ncbi:MAG: peptide ABC transporter substrate-binding protein [Candidatus Dormibacteraeota bacterium]|nr:peptide ABC transporter substrate-binding protein [Candidatus Dormibacteraeota bacterium]
MEHLDVRFRALRGAAVLGTISLLIAACGTGSTNTNTNTSTQLAADQTFRFPLNDDIGSFDPGFINAAVDAAFAQNLYDGLLKFDDNLKIVPDIAEAMPEISSDQKTYTFKLRKDVKFSNGDKVTAKDFIYSWSRAARLQGDYASDLDHVVGYKAVKAKTATSLSGMSAPDDYTLKVQLTEAAGFFLTEVAFFPATTAVVSQKAIQAGGEDTWWTKPETLIGTGPFKMSARTPKQSLDFVPVDNWWGSPKPTLKKIHVDIIADLSSAIAKYDQNGFDDVGYGDMNGNIPPEDILRIKAGPKASELKFVPKVRTTWVGYNFEKGPFAGAAGKDLRKAFSLAIDRSKLVDVACSHGITCTAATGGLISKGLKGYLGDNMDPLAKFDAATAKQLLQSADPNRTKVKGLTYNYNPGAFNKAVAENLQSQWQDNLGVKVDLAATERQSFFQRRTKKEYIVFRHSWQADYDHPQDWFDNLFVTDAGNGGTGYSNPQLDSLVKTADGKKLDDALADYKKASQMMIDDAAYAPLVYTQGVFLFKPYVKGAGANGFNDFYWNEIQIAQH